jgi:hypothetical protein
MHRNLTLKVNDTLAAVILIQVIRPLWEGDQGVAKRSDRNKPMWVALHKCMEATLGISFYPKLAKLTCLFHISYVFSSTKSEKKRME